MSEYKTQNTLRNRNYWAKKGFKPCNKCPNDPIIHSHMSKWQTALHIIGASIIIGTIIFIASYLFFSW